MTRKEAIWYLSPIAENASLERYKEALTLAISALREQEERENPNPLTLDELIEIRGEPVFCVDKVNPKEAAWGIMCVSAIPHVMTFSNAGFRRLYLLDTLGINWMAYRQKPE